MTANPRTLSKQKTSFRIGDPDGQYSIYSGEGARRVAGRWHTLGQPVIYTSEHYSTAMLEKLVHYNGILPDNQHYLEITIPAGTTYEVFSNTHVPDWHIENCAASREFGKDWFTSGRSCILIVPSVVARLDNNILINTTHSDFAGIEAVLETPIWWDDRLFS